MEPEERSAVTELNRAAGAFSLPRYTALSVPSTGQVKREP